MGADRSPYALGPKAGPPVVLLHGLTGSPWDLRLLAEALAARGHRAVVPCLDGHRDIETLAASRWRDWYGSAEETLVQISHARRAPLVIGFSMGALLALRLAAHHPGQITGLVILGVPIEQPRWHLLSSQLMVSLRRRSPRLAERIGHHPKKRSDVCSQAVADQRSALSALPYAAIVELGRLQAEVRGLLHRIETPTLLLHGVFDHVAPLESSARVSQALGSSFVRRVVLPRSYHHVARDLDRERVREEVLSFAAQLGSAPMTAATRA